jgi:outer membrane biosynthesis protein TonB
VSSSEFSQEMGSLNAQIEQLELAVVTLEDEQRVIETELDAYAIDQQNISLLEEACNALDKLRDMGAEELFWGGLSENVDLDDHSQQVRGRIDDLLQKTHDLKEKRVNIQGQIDQHQSVLAYLFDEVQQAHSREERRQEEFALVREESVVAYHQPLMPWSKEAESERRFRKAIMVAMFWCLLFGIVIPMVTIPIPDRTKVIMEIPARMAMLLKEEAPPVPPPKPAKIKEPEKTAEPEIAKKEKSEKVKPKKTVKAEKKVAKKVEVPKPKGKKGAVAKKKKRNVGVLAFKSSFTDLIDEVPVAALGSDARVNKVKARIPGEAKASRSLVASQASGGGSSGIGNFGVSRNLGNGGKGGGSGYGNAGQIGGVGTGRVESAMAGMKEEAGRLLSDGAAASRTDEEIQIVFDRYKATLYRIYNKELRKDPTLKGRITLRLTIESNGEVSMCQSESSDLGSKVLIDKIVARVKRFNFGPKEGVPQITIRYPIDFLPAG